MKIPLRYKSIVFLFLSAIILSAATPVVAKLIEVGDEHLIDGRNPISFCNVLFAGNIVALLMLMILYNKDLRQLSEVKLGGREWLFILIGAILSGFLAPSLFFLGIQFANVVNVVLFTTLEIPLALLIGRLIFREKMKVGVVIGAFIVLIGVLITTLLQEYQPHTVEHLPDMALFHFFENTPWSGEISVFLAVIVSQTSLFFSRYIIQSLPQGLYNVFRVGFGGIIFFWLVVALFGLQHFVDLFSPFLWQWMLLYGAVIIALSIYFRYRGLREAHSAVIAISAAIIPISSIFFAFLILGVTPTISQWIGGSITIFGILISLIYKLRKKEEIILEQPIGFSGI